MTDKPKVTYNSIYMKGYDSAYAISGLLILLFNIAEITFITKAMRKKLHISKIYLLNLAISDAMFGIAVIIMAATSMYQPNVKNTDKEGALVQLQFLMSAIGLRMTLPM